ncbi:hypothetical protein TIFTF001_025544 [Ficus carica]|uniref:Uncharacterized protein n=1 Tax=Ficus carica TaxID=3494 RepID=A0AA88AYX8_FICCA|nr:hypothetical protein TIFTF001_025544 [Ficus carica]
MNRDRVGVTIFGINVATDLAVEIAIGRRSQQISLGRSRFGGATTNLAREITIQRDRNESRRGDRDLKAVVVELFAIVSVCSLPPES